MDVKDCQLLITLYEEKNITKAAEKLYISQPAITYRLQQIEEDYAVRIVHRYKKGVIFTNEGEYLVRFAQHLLDEIQKAKDMVQNMKHEVRGTLRIASTTNFSQYKLAYLMEGFLAKYPKVHLQLKSNKSYKILQMLNNDQIQLAILRGDYHWLEKKKLIHQERIGIVSKTPIDLERLPEFPRIHYITDKLLEHQINNWWQDHFTVAPNNIMEVNKAEACRDLAIRGLGYAIIPEICLENIREPFYFYPLYDKQGVPLIRNTWLFYREKATELSTVKAFLDYIEEKIENSQLLNTNLLEIK